MSSVFSFDREIVQLPDTVGVLWVYQTSQRNWVTIKVHYGYLRKCLLGWHESRSGFVTPCDGEVYGQDPILSVALDRIVPMLKLF